MRTDYKQIGGKTLSIWGGFNYWNKRMGDEGFTAYQLNHRDRIQYCFRGPNSRPLHPDVMKDVVVLFRVKPKPDLGIRNW